MAEILRSPDSFPIRTRTLLENGSISINWLIDYGLAFSCLCYLLSLNCYLLLGLNRTNNTITLQIAHFSTFTIPELIHGA